MSGVRRIDRLYDVLAKQQLHLARFYLEAFTEAQLDALEVWTDALLLGAEGQIQGALREGLIQGSLEASQIEQKAMFVGWGPKALLEACAPSLEAARIEAYLEERRLQMRPRGEPGFSAPAILFYLLPEQKRTHLLRWIEQGLRKIKSFSAQAHSYHLKHVFERDERNGGFYTSEAEFKGAMIKAGYRPKHPWSRSHIYRVSKRSPALLPQREHAFIVGRRAS